MIALAILLYFMVGMFVFYTVCFATFASEFKQHEIENVVVVALLTFLFLVVWPVSVASKLRWR